MVRTSSSSPTRASYRFKKGAIDDPTATVLGEEQNFIDLFNQELDPMGAVMSGKLVLKGDVEPFMELELF